MTINSHKDFASFILTASGIVLMFIGIFTQSITGKQNKNKSGKGKPILSERIKNPDSLLLVILQWMLVGAIGGMFFGIFYSFFTETPQDSGLYKLLAYSTDTVFPTILYNTITGAALGGGITLFFLTYYSLIFAGIFLGIYVFREKNKYLLILFGAISSVIALIILWTILGKIGNFEPMGNAVQYVLIMGATIFGGICGEMLYNILKEK